MFTYMRVSVYSEMKNTFPVSLTLDHSEVL